MGEVRFKGELVYSGPICEFQFVDNWCDSMATYYPYIVIHHLLPDGHVTSSRFHIDGASEPSDRLRFDWSLDQDMVDEVSRLNKLALEKRNAEKIEFHKLVKVVKGRKVPIGTEGEICWMGVDSFGNKKVGIRLLNGNKVYTAESNVRRISDDELFEREFLGK